MKNILIVDDDKDFAEGIADIVELEGHHVDIAFDGAQAIEFVKNQAVDVVLMDIRMPGMNGVETVLKLKEIKFDINVVMMTGYLDRELHNQALDNGAISVLNKPVKNDELFSLINSSDIESLILLIDDDEDFSLSLKSSLLESGYHVHIERSGQDAINYAVDHPVDLILLDLRIPGADGLQVYNSLQNKGISLPTFVITAYAEEEIAQIDNLYDFSVDKVFRKPIDPDELIKAIKEI